jgi:hypothetical protein
LPVVLMGGCPDEPDNPNLARLAGRWELVSNSAGDDDAQTFLEFDTKGELTKVEVIFDGGRATTSIFTATADVIGDAVRVSTRVVAGRVVFEGQFNADDSEIVGESTTTLSLPGVRIVLDGEPARMVRVE